jgi:hypothetical protein
MYILCVMFVLGWASLALSYYCYHAASAAGERGESVEGAVSARFAHAGEQDGSTAACAADRLVACFSHILRSRVSHCSSSLALSN